MARFEVLQKTTAVFIAIGVLSALVIFVVTIDAKHRLDIKNSEKNESSHHKNVFSDLARKLYDAWRRVKSNATSQRENDEVGINRIKRHVQDPTGTGTYSKISMLRLTIQQEPNSKSEGDEEWNGNPMGENVPVPVPLILRNNEMPQFEMDNLNSDVFAHEANRDFEHKERHATRLFPDDDFEELSVNDVPEIPRHKKPRKHRRRGKLTSSDQSFTENNGGNSLTYIFANNSVYVIDKANHTRRRRRRDIYIYSWFELAIAAAGAVAVSVTIIGIAGLTVIYCCPSKKKRRHSQHKLLLNMDDLSPEVVIPTNSTNNAAVVFTKSYIQLERNPAGYYVPPPMSTKLVMLDSPQEQEKREINPSVRRSSSEPSTTVTNNLL